MANNRLVTDRAKMQEVRAKLINLIKSSKENFYNNLAKKLNDLSTSNKMYWSVIKTFSNSKQVHVIPPLLINNNLISNFKEKANVFNNS